MNQSIIKKKLSLSPLDKEIGPDTKLDLEPCVDTSAQRDFVHRSDRKLPSKQNRIADMRFFVLLRTRREG